MPKRLDITPAIKAALLKSTDGAVDGSTVAVFETISLNTKPLSKRGLFDKARVTESTLREMAASANAGNNIPLHVMHDQADNLPVGKTFMAEIYADLNGQPELRSLFYIPLDKPELVSDVENDVIGEVSVGIQTKHINCSECGWDFMGDDSTFSNLYNGTCANEHEIGVNGVHVILNGLDRWYEQSLVSIGAANGARIQSRMKSLIGAENYDKLAASGHNPEITVLHATLPIKKASNMDLTALTASLVEKGTQLGILQSQHTAVTTELATTKATLATAQTDLIAANAKVTTLEAAAMVFAGTDAAKLKIDKDAAVADAEKARLVLLGEATRMAVALNIDKPDENADITTLVATLDTNRTKMTEAFAPGKLVSLSTGTQKPNAFKGA